MYDMYAMNANSHPVIFRLHLRTCLRKSESIRRTLAVAFGVEAEMM